MQEEEQQSMATTNISPDELRQYVGTYKNSAYGEFIVELLEDTLRFTFMDITGVWLTRWHFGQHPF